MIPMASRGQAEECSCYEGAEESSCGQWAAFARFDDSLGERVACVGARILQRESHVVGIAAAGERIDVEAGGKDTTAEDMVTRVVGHGIVGDGNLRTDCEVRVNVSAEVCDNGSRSAACLDG